MEIVEKDLLEMGIVDIFEIVEYINFSFAFTMVDEESRDTHFINGV